EEDKLLPALALFPAAVVINRQFDHQQTGVNVGFVVIDDVAGGKMATRHLIGTGHKNIGFLSGPTISQSSQWRSAGYQQALLQHGLSFRPDFVVPCSPTVEGGCLAADQLLTRHPELSALFCYNDLVAIGALQVCTRLGRSVPKDLAIVGFDDNLLASLVSPPLTTCRVDREVLGRLAGRLLVDRIRGCGDEHCGPKVLSPELVVRASAP
ncbi:MAG: substrate-binding domain-containing protein, partial [Anaerolineaceae bacterium]|nr:substrate-binding domain-containing protein [Anaerolineaceae bacterium]